MTKPTLSLKRRLLRLFLWLAGIALAFVTYSALLGAQTNFYLGARYIAHRDPVANIIPQPLAEDAISHAPGTTLSYYGNTFEVPWKGITEQKAPSNVAVLDFASGQDLMIWETVGQKGFLQRVVEDKTMGSPQLRALFAMDIKDGPYHEESALLNATSDHVRFFVPPRVSARPFFLLFFKTMAEESEAKTGIYAFRTPAVRGFQLGNPAYSPHVRLDFFDLSGNSLGQVSCYFGKDASARGTQADLNRIIQTFRPLANASASSPGTNQAQPPAR